MRIYDPFKKRWLEEAVDTPGNSRGLVATCPFVDTHTHVRLNGGEDYSTLEEAAMIGGYSTLLIQPNTRPVIDTPNVLKDHIELTTENKIRFLWTAGAFGELETNDKNLIGYSTDGLTYNHKDLVKAMKDKKKKDLWFDHSQIHELDGVFYEGTPLKTSKRTISNEATAIYRTVLTGLEYGYDRFHIQHISTSESLEAIAELKKRAIVSCEVTPHHLLLNWEMIRDTDYKINPPLASESTRQKLVEAVKSGKIEAFGSDHAPHFTKPDDYETAPFGSSHIEVAFSAYYTAIGVLETVIEKMTVGPMKIMGINNRLNSENLVIIDPEGDFTVEPKNFKSKGKNCAFKDMRVKGKILGLKLKGKWVMWNGEILPDHKG